MFVENGSFGGLLGPLPSKLSFTLVTNWNVYGSRGKDQKPGRVLLQRFEPEARQVHEREDGC